MRGLSNPGGGIGLPKDVLNGYNFPPQRRVHAPSEVVGLVATSGGGSPLAQVVTRLQEHCIWLYLEADGGADIYIAPEQNGGGFITRLQAGKCTMIPDGCYRIYYGLTAPTQPVQVIGCSSIDAFILAQGTNGTMTPIPGTVGGQTSLSAPAALPTTGTIAGGPSYGPFGVVGVATTIVVMAGSPNGLDVAAFPGVTMAALKLNAGGYSTLGAGTPMITVGGNLTVNGIFFIAPDLGVLAQANYYTVSG
jgi:hypothetical protein